MAKTDEEVAREAARKRFPTCAAAMETMGFDVEAVYVSAGRAAERERYKALVEAARRERQNHLVDAPSYGDTDCDCPLCQALRDLGVIDG